MRWWWLLLAVAAVGLIAYTLVERPKLTLSCDYAVGRLGRTNCVPR